mmetsp:Transcript_4533/g.7509  ORF Transcript_4533/g.7509 Transcript_4533/m.7509 type:complete len:106 (+) Transcript_4533:5-322(+)
MGANASKESPVPKVEFVDPRSPSCHIPRTPKVSATDDFDPRSPTKAVPRTPVNSKMDDPRSPGQFRTPTIPKQRISYHECDSPYEPPVRKGLSAIQNNKENNILN